MPQDALTRLFSQPRGLVRLAGAHNPMGARLAERAGFDGVWASSLEISTAMGSTDTGANTMSHVLDASAAMAAAIDTPVVADCGPVIGGMPGVARMVQAFEGAGVAAVCIEDSLYPKTNSLLPGEHELVGVDEFSNYLSSAIQTRKSPGFPVIARIESLIAGEPVGVALTRASAYKDAGADAILVHSKSDSPDQVLDFVAAWDSPVPLVLIPTTYYSLTEERIRETQKVKMVIYANHGIRAAVHAMRNAYSQILSDGSSCGVRKWIAPIKDLFDIQTMSRAETHSDHE